MINRVRSVHAARLELETFKRAKEQLRQSLIQFSEYAMYAMAGNHEPHYTLVQELVTNAVRYILMARSTPLSVVEIQEHLEYMGITGNPHKIYGALSGLRVHGEVQDIPNEKYPIASLYTYKWPVGTEDKDV